MRLPGLAGFLALALIPEAVKGGDFDESLAYRQAVHSMFLVQTTVDTDAGKRMVSGTGVLIDAGRRYVLTAYHVVGEKGAVVVYPPALDEQGEIINDPARYLTGGDGPGVECKVLDRDAKRDLALLVMAKPPTGRAMPLARRRTTPGQKLMTIGNTVRVEENKYVGVLWRFSGGHVRAVYRNNYRFEGGQEVAAMTVESTVPLNNGDSGGALFNRNCELVGINSATTPGLNQVQQSIDIGEILDFLSKPGRELSLTTYDAERSQVTTQPNRLCYAIMACNRGDGPPVITHRFHVTANAEGEVIASPIVAEAAGQAGLIK